MDQRFDLIYGGHFNFFKHYKQIPQCVHAAKSLKMLSVPCQQISFFSMHVYHWCDSIVVSVIFQNRTCFPDIPKNWKGRKQICFSYVVNKILMTVDTNILLSCFACRYRLYMKSVVQTNVRKAQRGGEPGTISLVKSFIGIRLTREPREFSQVCPIWPLIYYCLRCGDIAAALRCAQKDG